MKLFLTIEFAGGSGWASTYCLVSTLLPTETTSQIPFSSVRIGSLGQSCCPTWFKRAYDHNLIDRFALVRSVER